VSVSFDARKKMTNRMSVIDYRREVTRVSRALVDIDMEMIAAGNDSGRYLARRVGDHQFPARG